MNKNFGLIFGAIIAYILLILYTGTAVHIIKSVINCANDSACAQQDFTEGLIHVVTFIGGLISALVVSKLTITTPGENPAMLQSTKGKSRSIQTTSATLIFLYLGVWVITGLAALVVGVMLYPGINSTLSDIGTTWLGIAVASGYAYFGLDPK
jgi:hypothetical protein